MQACVSQIQSPAACELHHDSWEQLFLAELPTIDRIALGIARRNRLPPAEAEDFAADVRLRILADDYAVLRKFRSRCTLRTFLSVVIRRMFQDYRNAQWGKWRASARCRREGDAAVLMERLTVRDGLTFDEAHAVLATNHPAPVNRGALEALYAAFRRRPRPRFVSDDELCDTMPSAASADADVVRAEDDGLVARAMDMLGEAIAALAPQDRLILEFHFGEGLPISVVARQLGLEQKQMYRRLERVLKRLRASLERAGVDGAELLASLGRSDGCAAGVFSRVRVESPAA
jgi:RNA polymerase sigma factor (sigma-70 family)